MAVITGNKKRIPISVQLFNKKGEVVQTYYKSVKSRIVADVQVGLQKKGVVRGTCRVTYNREQDYWNEFDFTDFATFNKILSVDTEKSLVQDFL